MNVCAGGPRGCGGGTAAHEMTATCDSEQSKEMSPAKNTECDPYGFRVSFCRRRSRKLSADSSKL